MITIKNKVSLQKMATAGKLLSEIFDEINEIIKVDISTLQLDEWIEKKLREKNLVSQTKGYMGYKHSSCISVNDEVVHGIPHESRILQNGDLIKIDICVAWKGYCADMARCFFVGVANEKAKQLVDVAELALQKGISKALPGAKLSDISAAIQEEVEKFGFGVVRDFAGHGIGKNMHETPEILNYGLPGKGPILRPGMTFAIEPMITLGGYRVFVADDGWTVKTKDKSLAAHVEDTIEVTEGQPKILTRP
ncbi:type I methionyl aminopeptidase [candidate division TM6 bacterium RIFCSPHIGHO2_12_FULL_32_22]|nr:MAG: type I methionyl aminopeptidase [candidate division TM6 bacterium RIFCSPHIGHO2_12_FULL_32_22]